MKIDCVYLLAQKYYARLTRICVASIRYWYPKVPIFLIKDENAGAFSTREIERTWNVGVLKTADRKFGWGFAHFEPLLMPAHHRFLVLDVDIVFVGRVLDRLEEYDEDFVVDEEDHPDPSDQPFSGLYFDLKRVKEWDPDFIFPGFAFNAGQFVGTSGIITKKDLNGLIDWSAPRRTLRPDIFNYGDQGVLNFVVMTKLAAGSISVARVPFMRWGDRELLEIDLERLDENSPYPCLIHWAGMRKRRMRDMCRSDILLRFEDYYYSRVRLAGPRRRLRVGRDRIANVAGKVRGKLMHRVVDSHLT